MKTMQLYLTRFSYTPETWARLIGNPEDRQKTAQSTLIGRREAFTGSGNARAYDGYCLWRPPDIRIHVRNCSGD